MIYFLARRLIKDSERVELPQVRQAYGMLCGTVGILWNLLLAAAKLFAGLLSGSVAITADAANNFSDAASSLIVLVGFRMAGQKPDEDHPFGHGRVEYISGLLVSVLIIFMAFELLKTSVEKILHPELPTFEPVVLVILVASILVKLYMFCYNRRIGGKISSEAMKATALDSLSDMGATTVVFLSALAGHYLEWCIDGYCGVLVACFIFYAGFRSARDTISPLLGTAPEPEFVKHIEDIVLSRKEIIGVHDLVVHNYGPGRSMISLHAEVPAEGDILILHDLIDNIERELREELHCEAVIHMDPVSTRDPQIALLKQKTKEILNDLSPELSFHDFRVVKGPTHTNLIFDLVIPYHFSRTDAEIVAEIQSRLRKVNENYYAVIEVDRDYTR